MCLEQIKNGEIEDVTEKCAIKQAWESFLSILRRCSHHKSDVVYPRQNPSRRKYQPTEDKEEFRKVEQNRRALRHREVK